VTTHAARGRSADVIVVGAGIVGLATALRMVEREAGISVLVVDKEQSVGLHQTSHNSGVIHRGVYYRPGSLKAQMCVSGAERLIRFCDEHDIPYRLIGKLIIASDDEEVSALDVLEERARANGVPDLRRLDAGEIRSVEPEAVGVAALHSPQTGIVDFLRVARTYAQLLERAGGRVRLGAEVTGLEQHDDRVAVRIGSETLRAEVLVTCAGLHADRLAAMGGAGGGHDLRIIPFRGDYYHLPPERSGLVRGLIYPVPDPRFPFLGVHFTPRLSGDVWLGPNAVPAFAREGYRFRDVSLPDLVGTLRFGGFWRMAARHWRMGAAEMWREASRRSFARALRRYVPDIRDSDLVGHASGVRAQAVAADGSLVDDFDISGEGRVLHVRNAPSPAATSSLAIGDWIAERAVARLSEAAR
jgi:L-2-hydroxyglutarate oxidase LhgO